MVLASPRNLLRKGFYRLDMGEMRHNAGKIREWLGRVLGPTAHAELYSDEYACLRFRNMVGFYGADLITRWGGHRNWV